MTDEKEPTFDAQATNLYIKDNYKPLLSDNSTSDITLIRHLAQYILNKNFNKNLSLKEWKKIQTISIKYEEKREEKNITFKFEQLCKHLQQYKCINRNIFPFPKIQCEWIDSSIAVAPQFYFPQNGAEKSMTFTLGIRLSDKFPFIPRLDREGAMFSTMQRELQMSVLRIRSLLVNNSDQLFNCGGEWLTNLFAFFNILVSLVDITLIQIYYKAKYDHTKYNWNFDESIMGTTVCRRMEDKLKWIGQITGNYLNDAANERKCFNIIKSIRNHFNHFDPPVMAYTIEDVASWLNMTTNIGMLLWKIREKLNCNISDEILSMILAPKILFRPRDPGKIRYKQKNDVGYCSCISENVINQEEKI